MPAADAAARVFKTPWASKVARKAGIGDGALCDAIREVIAGQADDQGGGVFKKRLDKNRHRSIIVAKGGRHWIYQYLFAKKDRSNVDAAELRDFRILAKGYAALNVEQIKQLLRSKDLTEICHGDKTPVQE